MDKVYWNCIQIHANEINYWYKKSLNFIFRLSFNYYFISITYSCVVFCQSSNIDINLNFIIVY